MADSTLDRTHKMNPAAKRKEISRLQDMADRCSSNIKNARARANRAHYGTVKHGMEMYAVGRYKKELALIRAAIAKAEGK
jgi:hypothetical protein